MPKQYLFLGASAASIGAMNKLLHLEPAALITCVTQEVELPYNKCFLADFLAGQMELARLEICPEQLRKRITFLPGTQVTEINPATKMVMADNDDTFSYDALLLAMGSSPSVPPLFRSTVNGLFTFHTLRDTLELLAYMQKNTVKHVIIVGAGLSGLECADSLHKKGIAITIVERNSQVLGAALSQGAASFLHSYLERNGITLALGQEVVDIVQENNTSKGIILKSGEFLPADMIICATGLRPNTELALAAGIICNDGAVVVNDYMQTNITDIYAAGDLIEVHEQVSGIRMRSCTWPDAMLQGIHAAHAMAGIPKKYLGPSVIASSSFFGLKYAHAGSTRTAQKEDLHIQQSADFYHEFAIPNGKLTAFLVLGSIHNLGNLRRALLTGEPFSLDGNPI